MKDALGHGSDAHGSGIAAAVPSVAYAMHREHNAKLDAASKQASAEINQFPRGPTGLTPDDVKATPEYQTAKVNSDRTFAALRAHNSFMVKNFKSEMKADRDAKRARQVWDPSRRRYLTPGEKK
jgi:hypothetical protein